MKNLLLTFVFIFLNTYGFLTAQGVYLGIQGGLSIPSLHGGTSEQSKGYQSRLGPDFGIFADFAVTRHVGLQLDVAYVSQGGIKKGMQPIPAESLGSSIPAPPGLIYADYENEAILNYIEVPLLLKFSINLGILDIYIDAGPYAGFLVDATNKASGTSQIYADKNGTPLVILGQPLPTLDFSRTTNIKSDINSMNYGVSGGVGLAKVFPKGELFLNARGSYGLTNIQKNSENGEDHTGSLALTIGYAIKL